MTADVPIQPSFLIGYPNIILSHELKLSRSLPDAQIQILLGLDMRMVKFLILQQSLWDFLSLNTISYNCAMRMSSKEIKV